MGGGQSRRNSCLQNFSVEISTRNMILEALNYDFLTQWYASILVLDVIPGVHGKRLCPQYDGLQLKA